MQRLGSPWTNGHLVLGLIALAAGVAMGCDDGSTNTTNTTSTGGGGSGGNPTTGGSGGDPTTGGGGATGGSPTGGSPTGGTGGTGGMMDPLCAETAIGDGRGSAIAISNQDDVLVAVNRDAGSVTVMTVDYTDGDPQMTKTAEIDLGKGSEPWQVAIDACGDRAYVVTRKDQKLHEIRDLRTAPVLGKSAVVGSEPTGIVISPNNTTLYVTNWVDGTVSRIDAQTMVSKTIDLNQVIAETGLLGSVEPRPALAHPRAIAITNDGDAADDDETVVVTEWFAVRTEAEAQNGSNADTSKKGLLYHFSTADDTPGIFSLPPVVDTGFQDHNGAVTGCFPNQVGSVTLKDGYAYVTSTCASPKGPVGVFQKGACTTNATCQGLTPTCDPVGSCIGSCMTDADCGAGSPAGTCVNIGLFGGACKPNVSDVRTTTHPAVSIIALADGTGSTTVLDKKFQDLNNAFPKRMPLLPTDLAFINDFAYVTAQGTDAVFRLTVTNATVASVGSATNNFINLRKDANDTVIKAPIGIAIAHQQANGFVMNDGSYDVTAIEFNAQAIAGDQASDFRITQSAALPAAGTQEDKVLRGRRFFTTGLGRWSLGGVGWGSCAACHVDGLTDNVTWYFARGPRQSTSLDGSFASKDGADQRILNWTAIFDEIADFEANTRGVSGGVGAIVSTISNPPVNTDRINTATTSPPQQGLQGSSDDTTNPAGMGPPPHGVLPDWLEIKEYIKSIRSPRRPTTLAAADVTAGKDLFGNTAKGNCVGCHSGAKWTISKVFWPVGNTANAATADPSPQSLSNIDWNVNLNGFPQAIWPINPMSMAQPRMRQGNPPGAEQIQCILRPVGTFNVAPAAVGVAELRADMLTVAQGNNDAGRGFNPPSLLGAQVGAPFYHAGQARSLEEAFDMVFQSHYQSAIAQVFSPTPTEKKQLIAYLLSIDEDEAPFDVPTKGTTGGDICFYP